MQKCPTCPTCLGFYSFKEIETTRQIYFPGGIKQSKHRLKPGGRQSKVPLLLNCGHTFCEICLQKLTKESLTSMTCPTCQKDTPLTDGTKSLWPDVYTIGAVVSNQNLLVDKELKKLTSLEMMQTTKKTLVDRKDKLCRECGVKMATCRCEKCDGILCVQCFDKVHSMYKTLKQHQAIPLATEESNVEISPVCKLHDGRPIEYYCEDDSVPICSRCVIMGDHKGHNIASMEEKNRAVVMEMEPALHTANKVVKKLKKAEKALLEMVPDMKTETTAAVQEIRQYFQIFHGVLQARERQLIEEVYNCYRAGIEPITNMRLQMQEDARQLEISIKAAQRILNNNNEIILNAKDILDQLQKAKSVPCIVLPKQEETKPKIRFIADNKPTKTSTYTINLDQETTSENMSTDWATQVEEEEESRKTMSLSAAETFITSVANHGKIEGSVPLGVSWHNLTEMPAELMNDDTDSIGSSTPADSVSVASYTETNTSEDVIIEEEQDIILEQLHPKHPVKKRGHNELVFVTHIHNPCQFMVQRCADTKKFRNLSRNMNTFCSSPDAEREKVTVVQKGDLVLGRYTSDNQWYRARVKQVIYGDNKNKTKLEVLYFDYGNSEVISLDRVRKMQSKFMHHPEFVIECCLFDIVPAGESGTWTSEAVKSFAKMTGDKALFMTVIREVNNVLHVDLSKPPYEDIVDDRPISIRDSLVFLDLAKFVSPETSNVVGQTFSKRTYLKPEPKYKTDKFQAIVTCAGDPTSFYVQEAGESLPYFKNVMSNLQNQYNIESGDLWSIYCPYVDMICACKFSGDGMWYRAKVIHIPGNKQVDIQYVDFGNTERVPYWNLRKILDDYIKLPAQAIHCSLSDVEPGSSDDSGEWTQETIRWWSDRVTMKNFVCTVTDVSDQLFVALYDSDQSDYGYSINGELVGAGYAKSTGKWSVSVPKEYIRKVTSSSSEEISTSSSALDPSSKMSDSSSVSLTSSKASTPVGSRSSTPRSQSPRKSTSPRKDVDSKSGLSSPQKPVQTYKKKGTDLKLDVAKASSVSQKSPSKSPHESSEGSANPESPSMVAVKICHFCSPSDFHVQLASARKDGLDDLMDKMFEEYDDSETQWVSWEIGSYCAAKYTEDNRWYRSKIVKIHNKNMMQVYMVDFGYYCTLGAADLRPLSKNFLSQMCFAFRCHLSELVPAGDSEKWSRTACEVMMEEIQDKKMYIQKKGDLENDSLPIDLLLEEDIKETALEPATKHFYSLADLLKEKGLGIPTVKRRPKKSSSPEVRKGPPKVYPVMHYNPPIMPIDSSIEVIPIYVDYEGKIYLQELKNAEIFQQMNNEIQRKFQDSEADEGVRWQEGQGCITHFHLDDMWYRAKIIQISKQKAQVQFVDFGNKERVAIEMLRADIINFVDLPQQCIECTLHNLQPVSEDGRWPVEVLDQIHKTVVSQSCIADIKVRHDNRPLEVDLMLPDHRDLATVLHKMGVAYKPDDISTIIDQSEKITNVLKTKNPYKMIDLSVRPLQEYFPVIITHIELPDIVYFQYTRQDGDEADEISDEINSQLHELEKMSAELNQIGPAATPLPRPRIGLNCMAQFGFDKCWYRALVIDSDDMTNDVLVLYVDYGTSEVVTLDRIRVLPAQFMGLPAQSVRLKLNDVQPPAGQKVWTKPVLEAVMQTLGNKELIACLKSIKPPTGELYVVGSTAGASLELAYKSVLDSGLMQKNIESQLYDEAIAGESVVEDQQYVGIEDDEDVLIEEEEVIDIDIEAGGDSTQIEKTVADIMYPKDEFAD